MKSRKQKLAKKAKQGLCNYQRKLDHEYRLQAELGTERFGYWQFPLYGVSAREIYARSTWFGDWQQDKPPQGKRVYHIEIVIKEKVVDRTLMAIAPNPATLGIFMAWWSIIWMNCTSKTHS